MQRLGKNKFTSSKRYKIYSRYTHKYELKDGILKEG